MCLDFIALLVVSIAWSLSVINANQPIINTQELDDNDAELLPEINRDFLIFWAILFFTCVAGIIELIPSFYISGSKTPNQFMLTIIFLGLVIVLLLSISQCLKVLRGNTMLEGRFRLEIRRVIEANPTLSRILLERHSLLVSFVILTSVAIFFVLLCISITA